MAAEMISSAPSHIVELPPKILFLSPGREYHAQVLMALKGCSHNVTWVDDPHELPAPRDPANIGQDLDFVRWTGETAVMFGEDVLPEIPSIIAGTGLLAQHELDGVHLHRKYDGKGLARLLGAAYVNLGPSLIAMIRAEARREEIPQFCDLPLVTKRTNHAIRQVVKRIFDA